MCMQDQYESFTNKRGSEYTSDADLCLQFRIGSEKNLYGDYKEAE